MRDEPITEPLLSVRDELSGIRIRCQGGLRLLMNGVDGIVIEETRRTLLLIDRAAAAAITTLDAGDDR